MKNVAFIISYLGDNPPKIKDIEQALIKADLDDEGIIQVEETNPIYELCDSCNGTGNEGTMMNIDCGNCGGSGWIKKEIITTIKRHLKGIEKAINKLEKE